MRTYQYKACTKCKETKSLEEFYRDKRNKGGRNRGCKECIASYQAVWVAKNRDKRFLSCVRQGAKKKGLPFDLTADYLHQMWTGVCPILGKTISREASRDCPHRAELDRIVPSKGYVKGNGCGSFVTTPQSSKSID